VHEELISLRRLALQGRDVAFTQAVLTWQRHSQGTKWSGSVRVADLAALPEAGAEAHLEALSLDGRTVSGQVLVIEPEGEATFSFAGDGPLIVEGREL
jgi:hypothetical protein